MHHQLLPIVRALERGITAICRKRARQIVGNRPGDVFVTEEIVSAPRNTST